jgi:hypothetical protein
MSNNPNSDIDHLSIVDGLTPAEIEAWQRLGWAELAVAEAQQLLVEITNREANKRRTRLRLSLVHPSENVPRLGEPDLN